MLGGIAVNNSIILVDRINQLSQAGMELTDAIVEAGQQRIRPIIMTTLTTILAMLPMTFSFGGRCIFTFTDGYSCDRRIDNFYSDEFDGYSLCLLCLGEYQKTYKSPN